MDTGPLAEGGRRRQVGTPVYNKELNGRGLAYVHVGDFTGEGWHARLRPLYEGVYFAGAGLTKESGEELLAGGLADAVVYGTKFISNPDLPRKFKLGALLNEPDRSTFYTPGERGYTDYPTLGQATVAA